MQCHTRILHLTAGWHSLINRTISLKSTLLKRSCCTDSVLIKHLLSRCSNLVYSTSVGNNLCNSRFIKTLFRKSLPSILKMNISTIKLGTDISLDNQQRLWTEIKARLKSIPAPPIYLHVSTWLTHHDRFDPGFDLWAWEGEHVQEFQCD